QGLRTRRAFRSCIIMQVVKIDLWIINASPSWLFHGQPTAIGVQTPFEQPLRLLLLGRNETDNIFIQAFRGLIDFDFSFEAIFVLVHIDLGDLIDRFLHSSHVFTPISPDTRSGGSSQTKGDALSFTLGM